MTKTPTARKKVSTATGKGLSMPTQALTQRDWTEALIGIWRRNNPGQKLDPTTRGRLFKEAYGKRTSFLRKQDEQTRRRSKAR